MFSAQRMGLVNAPDQLLTETEWQNAKAKSNQRDDSKMPCVICKEDFGTQEQVHIKPLTHKCLVSLHFTFKTVPFSVSNFGFHISFNIMIECPGPIPYFMVSDVGQHQFLRYL